MKKKWQLVKKSKIKNQKLKIEEIISILLNNRGLKTKKEINNFLNPPDPYAINPIKLGIKKDQISKAIQRIKKAITNKEPVFIYGDYDADGVCATAIMWETLYHLGAKVMPFIPHREELGYGLKKEGIEEILKNSKFIRQPADHNSKFLIITVDNGIVAMDGVEYCRKLGIDVVITDHHQKKIKNQKSKIKNKYDLPKAHSIIWSDQISGAGVAWSLAKAVYQHFHHDLLGFKASNSLELASIGTITDMMPMQNFNRSLVKFGLEELRKSHRSGIKALCQISGVSQKEIDTYHIGYIIGPRLNSAGRLEDAIESLRLLCTNNSIRAETLANKLHLTNRARQDLTQATLEHAKKSLKPKAQNSKLIFISHPSYNQGVIGLVAGKLVEEYYRPAVVIAKSEIYSKGSVRSIKGFDIIRALRRFDRYFEDLGGHPMAAGFTIKTKNIKNLEKELISFAKKEIKKELLQPVIKADLEIDLEDIDNNLVKEIEKFSPYGLENPRPVFITRKVKILNFRTVGRDNKHLKLTLQSFLNTNPSILNTFNAIAFNLGSLAKNLKPGQLIDICFVIEKNTWNGKERLELRIKDIHLNY